MEYVYELAGRAFTLESAAFAFVLAMLFGLAAWRQSVIVIAALVSTVALTMGDVVIQALAGAPFAELQNIAWRCLSNADWEAAAFRFATLWLAMTVIHLQKLDWRRQSATS